MTEHQSISTSNPWLQSIGGQVSSASNGLIYCLGFSPLKWNRDWQITWSLVAAPAIQHVPLFHNKLSYPNNSNSELAWSILWRQSQNAHHCLWRRLWQATHRSTRDFNCLEAASRAVDLTYEVIFRVQFQNPISSGSSSFIQQQAGLWGKMVWYGVLQRVKLGKKLQDLHLLPLTGEGPPVQAIT